MSGLLSFVGQGFCRFSVQWLGTIFVIVAGPLLDFVSELVRFVLPVCLRLLVYCVVGQVYFG